jgi:multidrug resistance efflux pump
MDLLTAIRRLSSLDERIKELDTRKKELSVQIEKGMNSTSNNKVETIYGYTQLRESKEFDFSTFDEVAEAEKALKVAKANLEAAKERAKQGGATFTVKKVFAFYRNKAVSARAKKGRIWVSTIVSNKTKATAKV